MSFLEVNNIEVYYGDVQVIYDLSLHVEEGEVVSIIGGNGAGKSTLLRTISGLLHPDKGEIRFEGVPVHTRPPEDIVERGIVQVPEGRKLFSLMTVKENLIVGAYNQPRRPRKGSHPRAGVFPVSAPPGAGVPTGHDPFRRRAADGGYRQGNDGQAETPNAG